MENFLIGQVAGILIGMVIGGVLTATIPGAYTWIKTQWAKATADAKTIRGLVADAQAAALEAKGHAAVATNAAVAARAVVDPKATSTPLASVGASAAAPAAHPLTA